MEREREGEGEGLMEGEREGGDLLDTQEIFWALSNVGFDPYSQVGTVCARARMRECRSSFVFYSSNCKSGYIGAHV